MQYVGFIGKSNYFSRGEETIAAKLTPRGRRLKCQDRKQVWSMPVRWFSFWLGPETNVLLGSLLVHYDEVKQRSARRGVTSKSIEMLEEAPLQQLQVIKSVLPVSVSPVFFGMMSVKWYQVVLKNWQILLFLMEKVTHCSKKSYYRKNLQKQSRGKNQGSYSF